MSERFTTELRAATGGTFEDAVGHRFTEELGAGTIDDAVFARYLLEDYAFVGTLVGTFGFAVGEAPTMADKRRLVEFLDTLTDEENDYFERSFETLGVDTSEVSERTPTTEAFVDLLQRAAREGGYAETLAVLVPAEWIYLEWASRVDRPEPFYLGEWVELHDNPAFESFVEWLRGQLDAVGPELSGRRRRRVRRFFCRTVDLEVAFFDAAYAGGGP